MGWLPKKREIKDLLVVDPDDGIRKTLAWDAKLETEYIEILAKDSEALGRESALNKLSQQSACHNADKSGS